MSLSKRLKDADRKPAPVGCRSCRWYAELTEDDQKAVVDWLREGFTVRQLHQLCASDPSHPLPVSESAFKNHIRDCTDWL